MAFQEVYEWLNKNGVLKKFFYLDEEILIALDGTEYFSSKKINCPRCNCRNHRNGTTTYFHVKLCHGDTPLWQDLTAVSHLFWFLLIKNK
jgi:hypothetical protein